MRFARALSLTALTVAACGRPASSARSDDAPGRCRASARLISERPALLEVEMSCRGKRLNGFGVEEDTRIVGEVLDGNGQPLRREGSRYRFAAPTRDARLHYRVDLESTAKASESFDVALRRGKTMIAPVSTWLARPEPLYTDLPVTLNVTTPPGVAFTTGLSRAADGYQLEANEIPVATYSLFGSYAGEAFSMPGRGETAHVELAIADGHLDVGNAEVTRWVEDSAREVAKFWHGFPMPRALVTVIPVPDRDRVVFGKVLPESSPGIVVLVGEHATREALYDDWILVHELFHLGVPSFSGEGKWFDEGLATYFEPLIRARAGWRSEESVWREFVRAMPQGLETLETRGLERAETFAGIYWGGAIVVMLADIEIRRATNGARGLEDGLRGVLAAGGQANEVWGLGETLALSDKSCGLSVMEPLARAHADHAERVNLGSVWKELGVSPRADGVTLLADAPGARLRHSVIYGTP